MTTTTRTSDIRTADLYGPQGAAAYHDITTRDTDEIVDLRRAVRRTPGEILELAAGAGRLTFALLALGREVTALELSGALCRLLADRAALTPAALRTRLTVVEADMTSFALGRRFGVVVLGTTSVSLVDEPGRRELYRRVAEHLAPGGRFLLTTRSRAAGHPAGETWTRVEGASGRGYHLGEQWTDPGTRVVTLRPETGPGEERVEFTSVVRNLPAESLASELDRAGFVVRTRTDLPDVPGWDHVLLEAEVMS